MFAKSYGAPDFLNCEKCTFQMLNTSFFWFVKQFGKIACGSNTSVSCASPLPNRPIGYGTKSMAAKGASFYIVIHRFVFLNL